MYETQDPPKKAFLVNLWRQTSEKPEALSLSRELQGLALSLGLEISGAIMVHLREHTAKYGMGTGKAMEIAQSATDAAADCIIMDWEMSPPQQRNWEELSGLSCLDRSELIIQIFADRARTREAALQVELARLKYSLPRLSHKYIDLARQRGGHYGAKGSGETKLETDRRLVKKSIAKLQDEIEQVRKVRITQRKKREKDDVPVCAIAGYTNAGKSSLLNALTGADALVENKLFATLDTTSRRIEKPRPIIFVDTVGFIRRLPHDLVDAFRSTLEEVALADIIIQVLDASDKDYLRHFETTTKVLSELGAGDKPMITVFNKIDCVKDLCLDNGIKILDDIQAQFCNAGAYAAPLFISVKNKIGLDKLLTRVAAASESC